jgi:hypothetical protein
VSDRECLAHSKRAVSKSIRGIESAKGTSVTDESTTKPRARARLRSAATDRLGA